jgi:hypothetical protein
VRLRKLRHNLKEDLLEKSKLGQHVYTEGDMVSRDEARILGIESNSMCRKWDELAHMACLTNPISQTSGSPLPAMMFPALRARRFFIGFYRFQS